MTITLTSRRTAVLAITGLAFVVAYLLGTAHGGGSVAAAATTGLPAAGSAITSSGPTPGITVTGLGKVSGTPDTLRLSLTVTANANTVSASLAQANAAESRVQKSLQSKGVAAKDLQTSGLSVQPNYTYAGNSQPTIHGYQATESLSVVLRDLSTAGATINSAVSAGGNAVRVDGISLDLDDTSSLMSSARTAAFTQAKAKAEQYAEAAGRPLGAVVSISEVTTNPTPVYDQNFASAGSAVSMPVPVQAGSQDVSVSVTVVFGLG